MVYSTWIRPIMAGENVKNACCFLWKCAWKPHKQGKYMLCKKFEILRGCRKTYMQCPNVAKVNWISFHHAAYAGIAKRFETESQKTSRCYVKWTETSRAVLFDSAVGAHFPLPKNPFTGGMEVHRYVTWIQRMQFYSSWCLYWVINRIAKARNISKKTSDRM